MQSIEYFNRRALEYDLWYERNQRLFLTEVTFLRSKFVIASPSLEVGCGSGRFIATLKIDVGIDPAIELLKLAKKRGMVICGKGEELPFPSHHFRSLFLITTIEFVSNPTAVLREASRVLRDRGYIGIGFIERGSRLSQRYMEKGGFYQYSNFYSKEELEAILKRVGFPTVYYCPSPIPGFSLISGWKADNA
ncbi:SAM-dependent methyltransferase [candidate division WOR-3 bacterium]|uniref:SAM-dependent methyltransferase n=1 Tax=candidate division WOR-3 bacterium TaxID=2052148 RepID=A0A660SHS2_UNCW3|nr:MAG: SAM-dependent methyltransferase [candidate division WOR-3 bacterium]